MLLAPYESLTVATVLCLPSDIWIDAGDAPLDKVPTLRSLDGEVLSAAHDEWNKLAAGSPCQGEGDYCWEHHSSAMMRLVSGHPQIYERLDDVYYLIEAVPREFRGYVDLLPTTGQSGEVRFAWDLALWRRGHSDSTARSCSFAEALADALKGSEPDGNLLREVIARLEPGSRRRNDEPDDITLFLASLGVDAPSPALVRQLRDGSGSVERRVIDLDPEGLRDLAGELRDVPAALTAIAKGLSSADLPQVCRLAGSGGGRLALLLIASNLDNVTPPSKDILEHTPTNEWRDALPLLLGTQDGRRLLEDLMLAGALREKRFRTALAQVSPAFLEVIFGHVLLFAAESELIEFIRDDPSAFIAWAGIEAPYAEVLRGAMRRRPALEFLRLLLPGHGSSSGVDQESEPESG
jgi:hypothetical protein